MCLLFPAFALTYVLLLIGLWNVAAGLLQLIGALRAAQGDRSTAGSWRSADCWARRSALLIMLYPADAAVSIIWLIAGTAVLVGLVLVLFAWKLRGVAKQLANA